MAKTRVLLADDHAMVRAGLAVLLNRQPDLEVVGEAGDGGEAIRKAQELRPDVVVMDISMPGMSGLEAVRQIVKRQPTTKCLVLSMHENEDYLFQALRAGASGYVVKKVAHVELIEAIRTICHDGVFLYPSAVKLLLQDYLFRNRGGGKEAEDYENLTDRQREVLVLVAKGYTNQEIAAHLVISVKTVEKHKAEVMERLGFTSRAALVDYALRRGLLTAEQ